MTTPHSTNHYQQSYRLPAEWEPQSAVILTWPHKNTDWAPMLNDIESVFRKIATEIRKREQLIIVAPEGEANNVECNYRITAPTNDTWARDHAFITLTPVTANGKRQLLDFKFNGWGEKFPAEKDNAINRHIAEADIIDGHYRSCLDFVLEGGSIESDGRNTVFTTTRCLMAPHRNQPLTQTEIEQRLKQELHAERIVWIDHGQLTGDDTDGHIDTLVRTAPNNTLLYIKTDDSSDEQYAELKLMEQQLRQLRTPDGQPYRLLALPLPHPIYDEGQRLPATYANFLVINGAVLCPTYGQDNLDRKAMEIIATAFPQRETIGIDCRPVIRQHGALHCLTMQIPV